MQSGSKSTPPVATGCFKCGRTGHWSRDCPYSGPASSALPNSSTSKTDAPFFNSSKLGASSSAPAAKLARTSKEPLPKLPRTRPKLTPELLLSNNGLGYVLERFPHMVKIRGPGHEVEDLKNLIEAYMHWHSHLLPYFTFDQFVEKVEKFSGAKRVRMCIREMREKVERGEELKIENNQEKTPQEGIEYQVANLDVPQCDIDMGSRETSGGEPQQGIPEPDEDLVEEFFKQATDESSLHTTGNMREEEEMAGVVQNDLPSKSSEQNTVEEGLNAAQAINAENKSRMEANRLKALERAKARVASK
ncbi:hypothetical protein O6H91_21G056400 [Diphasiastrum complanatum]|uniref:Uncharacterized protein n=1 Tax=Diphasiastrum complanatum TaxID=34168 RepID=A0ACC2AKP2_DIPCM|nr:hypothetical protein O6H91_21G056400 [Diphasiastrum complanatum]